MDLNQLITESKLTQKDIADKLGIRQPSVSLWNKRGIPLERVVQLERVTGIPRSRIRPDIFE